MKYYTGVGSRKTPQNILDLMTCIGTRLEELGWTLRSGGAGGADTAFTKYLDEEDMNIFIPWGGFNGIDSKFIGASPKAMEIAEWLHPAWERCSQGARKLHGRNVHQVLGPDIEVETYSAFVVCWTRNGAKIGGTATAIRLAEESNIPVFNLGIEGVYEDLLRFIGSK